jgi:hypothetical protein
VDLLLLGAAGLDAGVMGTMGEENRVISRACKCPDIFQKTDWCTVCVTDRENAKCKAANAEGLSLVI